MGLLDDAIREHLELKRLRGADPGLVAREERDAFGTARGGGPTDIEDDAAALGDIVDYTAPTGGDQTQESLPDKAEYFSNIGQETAELDMRAVLNDESELDVDRIGPVAVGPVGGGSPSDGASAEQATALREWEMPGDDAPGGSDERAEDDRQGDTPADQDDSSVGIVLEETPDFLRDAPEQEQLWFEQRSPQEFDFDR
jgi:hypothetical protein